MNKSKIYMIVSICILCISILGTSVAYYRKTLFNITANTITYGLDYYINYAKGQDISSAELTATDSYNGGASSDIELWKKDNTYDIYGHIYLDINGIGPNLSNSSALKYTLVNNGTVISEGTLEGSSGSSVLVSANIPLQTTKQLYTIYIWLDTTENPGAELESEVLSLTVRCEATMKPISVPVNLIDHITNLYAENYDSSKNVAFEDGTGMNYYAPNVRLMNDGLDSSGNMTNDPYTGNIRYYGVDDSNLKNYIYFNCSDYDNQSLSTCETWRIIGIVDGKVKIIRSSSIGDYAYDDNSNDWSTSTLKNMLNEGGTYYNELKTKNSKTLDLISESTWYINRMSNSNIYSNALYKGERTGSSTWPGSIALAYPSDYGYAADLNVCKNTLMFYHDEDCTSVNWLTTMYTLGDYYWLITPDSARPDSAWPVHFGSADGSRVDISGGVLPVLYLDSELVIESGHEGTSKDPYRISVS